jgi:hypothetical protein
MTRGWRKLHNEKVHKLYSSPSITTIRSRRVRWAGHVARMGRGRRRRRRRRMHIGYWWESRKEENH